MTRFIVCDTDVDFAGRLARVLHQHYDPCSVRYLYGPDALEAFLRSPSSDGDILLTEVELRKKISIEIIARWIKKSSIMQIIYMTPEIEHCLQVYETKHSGFLLKPVNINLLRKSVDRALNTLEEEKSDSIAVHRNGELRVINAATLLYVESSGRIINLTLDDERIEVYEQIKGFASRLDQRFLHCHKSYLVNMDRIRKYHGDGLLMEDGRTIPVSQSKRKKVREAILAYMGRRALSGEPEPCGKK